MTGVQREDVLVLIALFLEHRGHTVIGSAGSDDKVDYLLNELGLDGAFNYKSGGLRSLLRECAPRGIDVYCDNVGGDHLEGALHSSTDWGAA